MTNRGAGHMEARGGLGPARKHEAGQRFEPGVRGVDRLFQPHDLCLHDSQDHFRRGKIVFVFGRRGEIGTEIGVPSYLIDDADNLDPAWLKDVDIVGVTAGASAPEELVQEVIARLGDFAEVKLTKVHGVEENITFKLPRELEEAVRQNRQRA